MQEGQRFQIPEGFYQDLIALVDELREEAQARKIHLDTRDALLRVMVWLPLIDRAASSSGDAA